MARLLAGRGVPAVVLVDASSPAERELVDTTLPDVRGESATVLPLSGEALAGPLSSMPISLRAQDDPQGGNRFTGVQFPAPLGEADPAARVRAVREFVLSAREAAGTGVVNDLLAPALGWFPAPVLGAVSGWLTSANDVQVSNVPGGTAPLYIAGSRITRMYPFGPLPGCGAMITLLSHEDRCCIGVNVDAASVTDPAGLMTDLQAALDEVVALGGS